MNLHVRAIIAWAFVMVAVPTLPMTAAIVPEPSTLLVIGVMITLALCAAFVGRLFEDEVKS